MELLEEAIDAYRKLYVSMPFALYVDPITMANTNFSELELFGISILVSTACSIGSFFLVNEEQAKEIEEWEWQMRLVKDVRETLEKGREPQSNENKADTTGA